VSDDGVNAALAGRLIGSSQSIRLSDHLLELGEAASESRRYASSSPSVRFQQFGRLACAASARRTNFR